jgi:UTP--glucose-1-phosphate uridylyltransferase
VIPAAGLGTRLRPLTHALPKELLPVGRKPVLEHILDELSAAGIQRVLFVVSAAKPQIRTYFGESFRSSTGAMVECAYVVQEQQRGLGDAILCAEPWVEGRPFVVAFGDCIIEGPDPVAPVRRLIATHLEQASVVTTLVESVTRELVSRYGIVAPVESFFSEGNAFRVADIVEKPRPEEAPSTFAVAARYVLDCVIFDALRESPLDSRGELLLTDAGRAIAQSGRPFWAVPMQNGEFRQDIGSFDSFFAAFVRAACRDKEFGAVAREAARRELDRS